MAGVRGCSLGGGIQVNPVGESSASVAIKDSRFRCAERASRASRYRLQTQVVGSPGEETEE